MKSTVGSNLSTSNQPPSTSNTFAGVLHFLQTEWRKFERERNEWEIERSELKAQIAFLEGEKRGIENVKNDLMKRVKMLEFALRQERAKYVQTSGVKSEYEVSTTSSPATLVNKERTERASTLPKARMGTAKSRELLKAYLQEVNMLTAGTASEKGSIRGTVSSMPKIKKILKPDESKKRPSVAPPTNGAFGSLPPQPAQPSSALSIVTPKHSDSDQRKGSDALEGPISPSTSFLDIEEDIEPTKEMKRFSPTGSDEDLHRQEKIQNAALSSTMESYSQETSNDDIVKSADKLNESEIGSEQLRIPDRMAKMMKSQDHTNSLKKKKKMVKKSSPPQTVLDAELAALSLNDPEDEDAVNLSSKTSSSGVKLWKPKFTLRSHYDTVRAVSCHPTEPTILSASEDGTIKQWNLATVPMQKKHSNPDIEAVATYRGHHGPVTSIAICSDKSWEGGVERFYSAGADAAIWIWSLQPERQDPYAPFSSKHRLGQYIGHSDVVWDLKIHPLIQLLASASADGTVKLWDASTCKNALKTTITYNGVPNDSQDASLPKPISLNFLPSDYKKMIVSYQDSSMKMFDIEKGKEILSFKSKETYDSTNNTQINKAVCHPTMPIIASGHEDRYIRFYDSNTGECTHSMTAHLDAVAALDFDPSGLVLVSGGHDSSIRFWDVSSKSCIQEFTSHRKKFDEAVWSIKYHSTLPYLVSCGADSTVKVYI